MPGQFTTIQAYEWSAASGDIGGHHNVYYLADDPPIYRSVWGSPQNFQTVHEPFIQAPNVQTLYGLVKSQLTNKSVMVIPHFGGAPASDQWNDPDVQRLIEVSSEHQRSMDWASTFLQKGYHLGLMASSDGHMGHPGYGALFPAQFNAAQIGEGLVAVLAPENTRAGVFTSLYDRHCYATTGDRIVLDFQVNGALMGSEIHASAAPDIKVKVLGTTLIEQVDIVKDGQVVYTVQPNRDSVDFTWRDPNSVPGSSPYYYLQVKQSNGEQAWSSPVWVQP